MIKTLLNTLIYLFFPSIFVSLFTINFYSKEAILLLTISYVILIIFFSLKYKNTLKKDLYKFKKKNLITILIYWIIGFILMMLSNYIINYLIIPNGISNNEASNIELLLNNKITYTISLCILIPYIEEIVFRLELKNKIKNKYLFILTSSSLFAILHILSSTKLIELIYFIPYFILGITFSTIYHKTDNIYSNIITHILHNTIIVIFYLITL